MSADRTPESHPIRSNVPRSGSRVLGLLSWVGRHWVEARGFPDWGIPGTGKYRARTKTFHHPQQRLCAIHRRAEFLKSFLHQFQDSSWTLLCGLRAWWREFRLRPRPILGCISAEESHQDSRGEHIVVSPADARGGDHRPSYGIGANERMRARSDFGCGTEGAAPANGVNSLDRIAFSFAVGGDLDAA